MRRERLLMAAPYAFLFVMSGWLYRVAGSIEFSHQGDNLGPDFWPRVVLAALMALCAVQAVRIVFAGQAEALSAGDPAAGAQDEDGPRHHRLLGLGFGLTVAYGVLLTPVGFLTATVFYLALFMYIGLYRAHFAIWASSIGGAVLFTLAFQKVVYVSLPRGVFPFDLATDTLLSLF